MDNVSPAGVISEDSGVITGSHSLFVLRGTSSEPLSSACENTLITVTADEDATGELWVNTGDQWGPYAITTRLLDGPPGDLEPEWEDAVEVSIRATTPLVATELIDNEPTISLLDEPGDYRLRVSARGRGQRVAGSDAEEDAPIEWYLLEAWPAPPTEVVVLRSASEFSKRPTQEPLRLVIPEGEAGLAAAARIGRDVTGDPGARTLSGNLGEVVSVERTIPGTRRKLFRLCAHLTTWSSHWIPGGTWSFGLSGGGDYELRSPHVSFSGYNADQLTGNPGAIRWEFIEVDAPHRAARDWVWLRPTTPSAYYETWEPFPDQPTRIIVTLNQSRDTSGSPQTTIRIDHLGLPVEWIQDMNTYWSYQLSIAEHAGLGRTN